MNTNNKINPNDTSTLNSDKINLVIKHNCHECLYESVCKHKENKKEGSYCRHFKNINNNINIKAAPGDTVWLTTWYKTPKNTIVSRTILYVSFHEDKTIYHCKDGAFDESGFGDYAFRSLDSAKIVLSLRGNTNA